MDTSIYPDFLASVISTEPGPLGRQLITAPLAERFVFTRVHVRGILEDLATDLLVIARRVLRRVCTDLVPSTP